MIPTIPVDVTQDQINSIFAAMQAEHPQLKLPALTLDVISAILLDHTTSIHALSITLAAAKQIIDAHTRAINDLHEILNAQR